MNHHPRTVIWTWNFSETHQTNKNFPVFTTGKLLSAQRSRVFYLTRSFRGPEVKTRAHQRQKVSLHLPKGSILGSLRSWVSDARCGRPAWRRKTRGRGTGLGSIPRPSAGRSPASGVSASAVTARSLVRRVPRAPAQGRPDASSGVGWGGVGPAGGGGPGQGLGSGQPARAHGSRPTRLAPSPNPDPYDPRGARCRRRRCRCVGGGDAGRGHSRRLRASTLRAGATTAGTRTSTGSVAAASRTRRGWRARPWRTPSATATKRAMTERASTSSAKRSMWRWSRRWRASMTTTWTTLNPGKSPRTSSGLGRGPASEPGHRTRGVDELTSLRQKDTSVHRLGVRPGGTGSRGNKVSPCAA